MDVVGLVHTKIDDVDERKVDKVDFEKKMSTKVNKDDFEKKMSTKVDKDDVETMVQTALKKAQEKEHDPSLSEVSTSLQLEEPTSNRTPAQSAHDEALASARSKCPQNPA